MPLPLTPSVHTLHGHRVAWPSTAPKASLDLLLPGDPGSMSGASRCWVALYAIAHTLLYPTVWAFNVTKTVKRKYIKRNKNPLSSSRRKNIQHSNSFYSIWINYSNALKEKTYQNRTTGDFCLVQEWNCHMLTCGSVQGQALPYDSLHLTL